MALALVKRQRDSGIPGHGQRAGLRHIAEVGNRVEIVAFGERVGRACRRCKQFALGAFAVKCKFCRGGRQIKCDGIGLCHESNLNRAVLLADLHGLHRCGVLGVALGRCYCERVITRFENNRIAARVACRQRDLLVCGIGQYDRGICRVNRDCEGYRACGCDKPCGIGIAVLDFKAVKRKRCKIRRGNALRRADDLCFIAEAIERRPTGCALVLFVVVIASLSRDRRRRISAAVGKAADTGARHLTAEIAVCKVDGVPCIRAVDDADKAACITDAGVGMRRHIAEHRAVFKREIDIHHIPEHAAEIVVLRLCAAGVGDFRFGKAILHRERSVLGIADETARIGRLRRFHRDAAADNADIFDRCTVLADHAAEHRSADHLTVRQRDRRILEDEVARRAREGLKQRHALRRRTVRPLFGGDCKVFDGVTVAVEGSGKGGDRLHRDAGHVNVLRQLQRAGEVLAAERGKLCSTADAHGVIGKRRDRAEHRQHEKKPDAFEKSVFHGIYPFFLSSI